MPQLAKWFEDCDAMGYDWVIVYWKNTPPSQVTISEMEPRHVVIGTTAVPNMFTSRTSALRRSEESSRSIKQRTEIGHWGVWKWNKGDSSYFQSVVPADALKIPEGMVKITAEMLEQGKSEKGDYSQEQVSLFGVKDATSDWTSSLIGQIASIEVVEQFVALKDKHLERKIVIPDFIIVEFALPWAEQYQHPNWQRMRLFILERDGFQCTMCGEYHRLLHVHHLRYERRKFIWEVDPTYLQTVCAKCHSDVCHPLKNLSY